MKKITKLFMGILLLGVLSFGAQTEQYEVCSDYQIEYDLPFEH
ncbi:Phr family secreted Rap phosphatase inhibitor [Mesobacillus subterraneus]|nr:Phr family secreted Rap phosphatase inhibitor [Mesobacillus subterraneus]MCM3666370.1 Phr family secreted Rap phosphatase inhibitor [Mesobacillus subterraneus]MCM3685358.1 Phr family secreted Rap phosphatase inhibitor [Mesobacillus subterraneus]